MNMQPQRAPVQPRCSAGAKAFFISAPIGSCWISRRSSVSSACRIGRRPSAWCTTACALAAYRKRHLLGFARMVTDYATFASVSELFVSAEYRGIGLGSWLTRCCLAHPALRGLRVTLPCCKRPGAPMVRRTPCAPFTDKEAPCLVWC